MKHIKKSWVKSYRIYINVLNISGGEDGILEIPHLTPILLFFRLFPWGDLPGNFYMIDYCFTLLYLLWFLICVTMW
jgi:hypothetical protein